MKQVDYLIVGQGIAGSLLAIELMNAGKKVMVLNKETPDTSSNKAAGLYNPITGRQMVKTWLADELFPPLEDYYRKLEKLLGANFLFPKTIYRPFYSNEEQNDWQGKASQPGYAIYIKRLLTKSANIKDVNDTYGGLELNMSGYVDLPVLIQAARKYLTTKGSYKAEVFEHQELTLVSSSVTYRNTEAKKIIFCEGPEGGTNPFFKHLSFKPVKGELLDIEATLPPDRIINRGVFILPKDGVFRVGSTYDHSVLDHQPSDAGKNNLTSRLGKLFGGEYKIVGHSAGVRPATFDRKPFVGLSDENKTIGVFNGFGTKGVSLVPFFATQFVNYLLGKGNLIPEVSPDR